MKSFRIAVLFCFALTLAAIAADKRPVDWVKPEIDTHK
jgi:hypothetical protein